MKPRTLVTIIAREEDLISHRAQPPDPESDRSLPEELAPNGMQHDSQWRQKFRQAWLRGSEQPIPIETAETAICDSEVERITINEAGHVLHYGRSRRIFSEHQRKALEARDGGCLWKNCDRRETWTEALHIQEWSHNGETDIENGMLLCHEHHMFIPMTSKAPWLEHVPATG